MLHNALQEYFVGTTLAVIGREFEAEGIACDPAYSPPTGGQRRTLFQQYMHSVDLSKPRDARRVLNVFANVLGEMQAAAKQDSSGIDLDYAGRTFDAMCRLLKRDGYAYADGRVTAAGRSTGLDELQDAISPLDLPHHLQQQISGCGRQGMARPKRWSRPCTESFFRLSPPTAQSPRRIDRP